MLRNVYDVCVMCVSVCTRQSSNDLNLQSKGQSEEGIVLSEQHHQGGGVVHHVNTTNALENGSGEIGCAFAVCLCCVCVCVMCVCDVCV